MSSKKAIIIASAVICILLLTILFMDYKIRNLEAKNVDPDQIHEGDTSATAAQTGSSASQTSVANQTSAANTTAGASASGSSASGASAASGTESTTGTSSASASTDIGTIEIVSYPAGAAVYIDEVKVGTAPYKNYSMPVGNYSIKLMKAGLGDYCKKAYVYKNKVEKITGLMTNVTVGCNGSTIGAGTDDEDTADEEDEEAPADDEEETAETVGTTINSDPTGADVKFNGVTKGKTPLTKQFTSGTNLLKLYKTGYKTYSCFVEVNSNGEITSFDDGSEQNGGHTNEGDNTYLITLEEEE